MNIIGETFFPYYHSRRREFISKNNSFVYYTTAATAVQIIKNRQIWMRSTGVMNDHTEVGHGIECLRKALDSAAGKQLAQVLNSCGPGTFEAVSALFYESLPSIFFDTFITCVSAHSLEDDRYGRLSMWRAYGGEAGVALVLNPEIFFSETDALAAFTSPVLYADDAGVQEKLIEVANNIKVNIDYVRSIGDGDLKAAVFRALRFAAICTKHPAFKEEREWRIASSPSMQRSSHVVQSVETIGGIPQSVLKIPLANHPGKGIVGLQPIDFINKILIGPCEFPEVIARALADELRNVGFNNPHGLISITGIPLRPNQR